MTLDYRVCVKDAPTVCLEESQSRMENGFQIQLNPTLMDYKELTNLICYSRNFIRANIGNKKKISRNDFKYAFILGRILLVAGLLERGSTVFQFKNNKICDILVIY